MTSQFIAVGVLCCSFLLFPFFFSPAVPLRPLRPLRFKEFEKQILRVAQDDN
jgi:hypothetical protein